MCCRKSESCLKCAGSISLISQCHTKAFACKLLSNAMVLCFLLCLGASAFSAHFTAFAAYSVHEQGGGWNRLLSLLSLIAATASSHVTPSVAFDRVKRSILPEYLATHICKMPQNFRCCLSFGYNEFPSESLNSQIKVTQI